MRTKSTVADAPPGGVLGRIDRHWLVSQTLFRAIVAGTGVSVGSNALQAGSRLGGMGSNAAGRGGAAPIG